jgi:hypothetical protein
MSEERSTVAAESSADAAAAAAAGVAFRRVPEELDLEEVDELIRPAVVRINNSGWVWTAESCQGHPDSMDPRQWHIEPMLRLVCHDEHTGSMMAALVDAVRADDSEVGGAIAFTAMPSHQRVPGWTELVIYIKARTAYDRDRGIAAFERFAEFVEQGLDWRRDE